MKKYEINNETLAVIGVNKKFTRVVEKEKEYFINDMSYEIMEHSCEYFGSTYEGRIKGSKNMIGFEYKLPIIVEESNNLIFFPLTDKENPKCTWISLKWFDRVEKEKGITYIYLKNGKRIPTTVSKYVIENQVLRSSKLQLKLLERKNLENL